MEKTMLDVLKSRVALVDGLRIDKVKETNVRYTITYNYNGESATADLNKTCAPGQQDALADYSIATAISSMYFVKGDYKNARMWMDKIGKS